MKTKNKKCKYPDKFIIALTGGIATGKSLAANYLKEAGAQIVDTDILARKVVMPGSDGLKKIKEHWGDAVINDDGTLDRKALGKIIFSSKEDRECLNSILHPMIRREMDREIKKSDRNIIVLVIPLLYEAKIPIYYDESWLVYADEGTQRQRLMKRDNIDAGVAMKKIRSQINIEKKKEMADVIIDNSGKPEETRKQVEKLWRKLQTRLGLQPA